MASVGCTNPQATSVCFGASSCQAGVAMRTDCDAISDVTETQQIQSRAWLKGAAGQRAAHYAYAVKGRGNEGPWPQGKV